MAISQVYLRMGYLRGRDVGPSALIKPEDAMKAGSSGTVSLGAAAAFSAVTTVMAKLNDISLKWRIEKEMKAIKPSCDSNMVSWADSNGTGKCYDPAQVGTIIHVVYCVNSGPIGMSTSQFWTIFQGDTGLDAVETVGKYLADPSLRGGYAPVPASSDEKWMVFWYEYES